MKHLPDSRKRNHGFFCLFYRFTATPERERCWKDDGIRMAPGWQHQRDGTRKLERAKESRNHHRTQDLGWGGLAGSWPGWAHTTRGCDTNDSAMRTRFARQSTEGADGSMGTAVLARSGTQASAFGIQGAQGRAGPSLAALL